MTPDDEARLSVGERRAICEGDQINKLLEAVRTGVVLDGEFVRAMRLENQLLRASLAKCRKAARRLLNELPENMLIEYQDVAGVTNTRVLRLRIDEMCAALAATQDEETGT